ncbi:hypothetical protein CMQ_8122 [Grosmannia clavigera kw1407]|uniref:Mmc1 C-terminal domain-containing protein n=1 Tax=Grosmannia clavigera (strain kw1407 / UAMH 11150) TaxID=655863 RepID=F0XL00_GROCL|nr:uncharacterized protein CMQ_8122 [Grosmannia clavigera kw1407]EFX01656.1 hypothetical protein CMQ_8122 [Grosmannia clavigera kw1407]
MPPRLRLRPPLSRSHVVVTTPRTARLPPACLFCSGGRRRVGFPAAVSRFQRAVSTAAAADGMPASVTPAQARANLEAALCELQKHAGVLTNLPRLQLAIRGLQQQPGHETIRVAVLGLANKNDSSRAGQTAKELLRLVLADPLKSEEVWETRLAVHDARQPLVVRVQGGTVRLSRDGEAAELLVSSPSLKDSNMEFLVMESSLAMPTAPHGFEGQTETFAETVLVPTVDIPASSDGRYTSVATPVHQALIVTDGILGAAAVAKMPLLESKDEILAVVQLRNRDAADLAGCSFVTYDGRSSAQAIGLFRESVANALAYETRWRQSGMPTIIDWLRAGAANRTDGSTKPPVRQLVASVLRHALANIQDAEAKQLAKTNGPDAGQLPAGSFAALNGALAGWAEKAHAELQQQLDLAFSSRRWRKLGWWKLFWRVDDVTMLSAGLVAQRFLPAAEQEMVYLAGRFEEAARLAQPPRPDGEPASLVLYAAPIVLTRSADTSPPTRWPTHIAFTRRYLLDETVPALQALAQKLVLQTATTSGMTTALAVLTYLSSLGSYEAGAVAALGLVWSLGRMQRQWETARDFWESEVREEGRKAVRSVEASAADTLDRTRAAATDEQHCDRVLQDLRQARELVRKAEEALQQLQ